MVSIIFSGKIVMAMHIVTIEHNAAVREFKISLSNGLVLAETYENEEQMAAIAKKLAFDDRVSK